MRTVVDILTGTVTTDENWTPPALNPSPEEIIASFRSAIDEHVEQVARSRDYSGAVSLAGYVASTNPAWAAEAQAFVAWRDAVWVYAYQELAKVQAEERPQPTIEAFIAELPTIEWPAQS